MFYLLGFVAFLVAAGLAFFEPAHRFALLLIAAGLALVTWPHVH